MQRPTAWNRSANSASDRLLQHRQRRNSKAPRIESLEARHLLTVVINEFMAANETTLADEDGQFSDWIELRNTGAEAVDLGGWHLTDKADDLTKWRLPTMTLAAGDYQLVYASSKDRSNPEANLHTNFKLSADGEYLGLVRPDGETVAFEFSEAYPQQTDDVSYGLSADLSQMGFFAQASPGEINPGIPIADSAQAVIISEIMYSLPRESILDAENIDEEFIELHNRGFESVNLEGWRFTRGVDYTLSNAVIDPGEHLVIAANLESFTAKYPDVTNVVGNWTGKLSNSGETIELVDDTGNRIDAVRYADEGDWSTRTVGPEDRGHRGWIWASGHSGGLKSLELINRYHTNDNGQNWGPSEPDGGTPGSENSISATNVAPLIEDVHHRPILPTSTDTVIVNARLFDEQSERVSAKLHWRVDGEAEFVEAPMFDDGAHGDGEVGDAVFGAEIAAQASGTVIEFYVQSEDGDGLTRTWPAPTADGLQVTNGLYLVQDDRPELQPGDPPIYHQIMTGAERAEFADINRLSNAQFNATFIAETGTGIDLRYNTGIRIRGSASRNDTVPNNRVRIPTDNPWEGLTRLNLNSRAPVNQVSGSTLFRLAGLPASDVHAIRMYSNGVNIKGNGYYVHAEPLDGAFVKNHYPDDAAGNIYRGRRPNESPSGGEGAGLQYRGAEPEPYVSYLKSTNSSEADWSDVIDLTFKLNETPNETYVEDVQMVADVDQWFRAFAMNSLIDNNENGLFVGDAAGDDYAMYRGITDTRFEMIPYDWDSLYGRTNRGIFRPTNVPALNRLIRHPEFQPRYYAQFVDLIDNVILTDTLKPTLVEAIGDITSANRVDEIHQFLVNRANSVRNLINERLTVSTELQNANGLPRTVASNITITGTAPVLDTNNVFLSGEPVDTLNGNGSWEIATSSDTATISLLESGETWRYLDDGSDQGTAWREPGFDDEAWASGAAQLGYGDGDEVTTIGFGDDSENVFPTTYFRTTFELQDPSVLESLMLDLLYDDGAAVYINGVEAARLNLAEDATFDSFATTFRSNPAERQFERIALPNSILELLVAGENTIAVEVHQASAGSSDVSLDMSLLSTLEVEATPGLQLNPGINRLMAEAFDEEGELIETETLDIWFDTGTVQEISGTLTDATWLAVDGPYVISGNVVVPQDATLTIKPGTTIFFEEDARLTVRGKLVATGSKYQPVHFTRQPGSNSWNGIQFENSMEDNRIEHAILEYGVTDNGMIGLENSQLTLENSTLDHASRRRIRTIDSSLVVRNSTFTNITDPGVAPPSDNRSEHIWGRGIPEDGQWLVDGNHFGHITGHNDSIDFDAPKLPGPIPIIRNNRFVGGGDDALDMTGDVFIENNRFGNFIKDEFNTDPGESNTISSSSGTFYVFRNTFENVQHASLIKEDAFMYFLNNTVVNSSYSPLYFDLPGQTSGPGIGAVVEGSIFRTDAPTFDYVTESTDLTVNYSAMPDDENDRGIGNYIGDAHFGDVSVGYQLLPGSPAQGTGPQGIDMGSLIDGGALVTGVPSGMTPHRNATLRVGGPGLTQYRFRLNDGEWSDERSIDTTIELTSLAAGDYQVSVIGQDFLGHWQVEEDANVSAIWTVDPSLESQIRLNEILADNRSAFEQNAVFPDAVEIFNHGTVDFDLSGYSISDRHDADNAYVIPSDTILPAGEFLVLTGDNDSRGSYSLTFDLDTQGEGVFLFDKAGTLYDSVEFGQQLPDRSIGLDEDGHWTLGDPSLGSENNSVPLGDPEQLLINEWLTSTDVRLPNEFIELYNPEAQAIDLSGLWLTDNMPVAPQQFQIADLTFIEAGGFVTFITDGDPENGKDHTNFRLNSTHEHLALLASDLAPIDQIFYYPQTQDVSQGRTPDGADSYALFELPTPGLSNNPDEIEVTTLLDFTWDTEWMYESSASDLGTEWRQPEFDDSQWESGPGLLGRENEALPQPIRSEFTIGGITYYFRKHIQLSEVDGDLLGQLSTIIDDGAIVYINGTEVLRLRMPEGEVGFEQTANGDVNEAALEGPFDIPSDVWVEGNNVIAVEVHQVRRRSSDLVFGMDLAVQKIEIDSASANRTALLEDLRISEIMYNPQADENLEYLEFQNTGDQPLNLSAVRLRGGIEFEFPEVILPPDTRAIVASDVTALLGTSENGIHVIGEYDGNLGNGGDEIILQLPAPFDSAILRFEYDASWQPATDGGGKSLQVVDSNASFSAWGDKSHWMASERNGGTPGYDQGDAPAGNGIVINEILSHTDLPLVDALEIHNRSTVSVDLSGWYLTDTPDQIEKYRIPDGTMITPGGFLIFDENDFNSSLGTDPSDFALDGARGDSLWLWQTEDADGLRTIADHVRFGATANTEVWGRIPEGTGPLTPLQSLSLGQPNGAPRVGPVIVSELNYHPRNPIAAALQIDPTLEDDDLEYVEIFNTTMGSVDLTEWRIRGGIEYNFPAGTTLLSESALLVVSFDPNDEDNAPRLEAFRAHYELGDAVPMVGGYRGRLDNGGERIEIQRPDDPPAEDPNFIPRLLEDEVDYDDVPPWPSEVDGDSQSLERQLPAGLGRDWQSWQAKPPTPGFVPGFETPGDFNGDGIVDHVDVDLLCNAFGGEELRYDLDGDQNVGSSDMNLLINDILGTGVGDANLDGVFNSTDFVQVFQRGEYEDNIAGNSTWTDGDWDCDGDFTTRDLVLAFQQGNYVENANALAANNRPANRLLRPFIADDVQPGDDEAPTRDDRQHANVANHNNEQVVELADATDLLFKRDDRFIASEVDEVSRKLQEGPDSI